MNKTQIESNNKKSVSIKRKEKKKRWVRFDFSPLITFSLLLPQNRKSNLQRDFIQKAFHRGEILKLEGSGVLLTTNQALDEGNFLSLNLHLENGMVLDRILGKVKRVEKEKENQIFMGIEFCSKDALPKSFGELSELKSFERKLKEVILDYILRKKKAQQKVKV